MTIQSKEYRGLETGILISLIIAGMLVADCLPPRPRAEAEPARPQAPEQPNEPPPVEGFRPEESQSANGAGYADGLEVMARGPLHEAFAEVVNYNPEAGLVVPNSPPDPIEEVPPDVKPQGEGYVWISGYWAWDDDRRDFMWISGVWRIPPAELQWIPGYWREVRDGFQWISGYWSRGTEVTYLPPPPPSQERGPTSPQPFAEAIWIPGCWSWYGNQYVWKPGYWAQRRPGRLWIPAHYVWSPHGYIFVDGYWDYLLDHRGLVFAPVYWQRPVYRRKRFSYLPSVLVNLGRLHFHLFARPRYCHYYFGDYYANRYFHHGIVPWFDFHRHHRGFDPFYVYRRWHHARHDRDWDFRLRQDFETRRAHPEARPPRTFAADNDRQDRPRRSDRITIAVSELQKRETPFRIEKVEPQQRNAQRDRIERLRQFRSERLRAETQERAGRDDRRKAARQRPSILRLPNSPVVGDPSGGGRGSVLQRERDRESLRDRLMVPGRASERERFTTPRDDARQPRRSIENPRGAPRPPERPGRVEQRRPPERRTQPPKKSAQPERPGRIEQRRQQGSVERRNRSAPSDRGRIENRTPPRRDGSPPKAERKSGGQSKGKGKSERKSR